MNIIIFGATGTIGKLLVEQSLEQGHKVTAFCRNPASLNITHPQLLKVEGDVRNLEDVNNAIAGNDSVLITLGSGRDRKSDVRSVGTKNIIRAMQENGIKRLVCQTTLGCGDSHEQLNFFWKRIMFGWFLKKVFMDHELQESYVRNSGLDWTIVRPAAFTEGPKTKQYREGVETAGRKLTLKISRADVADFMLKVLPGKKYLFQTPGLSY
jgi:putative NADH-flavin reductase